MVERLHEREEALLSALSADLMRYQRSNARKWSYYDGVAGIKNIGIAIPQSMVDVESVVDWPEIIVSALAERINWLGWTGADGAALDGLESVFERSQIRREFNKAKIDSLVTGVGFLAVTSGDESQGEAPVIVNAVSPQHATYRWDSRRNRVDSGVTLAVGVDGERLTTLYLPDETVSVTVWPDSSNPEVRRYTHNRGRASLVAFENRERTGAKRGQSEITPALRYYTDHGIRTMLGMEYNREIYTTPQRYFENVEPEALGFEENDSPFDVVQKGYKVAMTRSVIVPPNDSDMPAPKVGQFAAAPPTPYIDEMEMLTKLVSSTGAVPPNYLGFVTQNPPSAESIAALEARLVKRAGDRIDNFSHVLKNDVAHVVQSILLGERAPSDFSDGVDILWRNPATPTKAAATDAALKKVSAGIIPSDSRVLLEELEYTPRQIRQIEMDRKSSFAAKLVEMAQSRQPSVDDPVVDKLAGMGQDPNGAPIQTLQPTLPEM